MNHLPFSAYSGALKCDMKIFVNVARLEIGQLFTQGARRGHPCTLDTFLFQHNIKLYFMASVLNFCQQVSELLMNFVNMTWTYLFKNIATDTA